MLVLAVVALGLSAVRGTALTAGPPPGADGALVCRIASEAAEPRRVRVEGVAEGGALVFDSGWFTLAPRAVFQSGIGAAARECRFIVEVADGLRAAALVFDPSGQTFASVPARRARSR